MSVIQHNLLAFNANRQLDINNKRGTRLTEKLSSGYRINRSADDAAGLTISEKMRSQIRGLHQASTNAQDGISYIQTAEGALDEIHAVLQRGRELSVKAANDTNMEVDRDAIQKEIDSLTKEIDRIATTTEFNKMKIFDDSNARSSSRIGNDIFRLDPNYLTYAMQDFSNAIKEAKSDGLTFTQAGLAKFANDLHDTYLPKLLSGITKSLNDSATPTVPGMKIGLKLYSDKGNGVLAYVRSNGVGYELGVNLGYLTESNGKVNMTPDLATTIAHEMTHAVMFDITTNGLLGSGGGDAFPGWFIEGTAQAIGGAINYCSGLTSGNINDDAFVQKWLSGLTKGGYNSYAQGYIGSMYLGYIAGGGGSVNAATISNGLDNILKDVSDGFSLSEAISRQTKGKYKDLLDFETNMPKDAVQFTRDLIKAIGNGTGSLISPNGLSGNKNSLLNISGTNNFFELDVDKTFVDNRGILAGKNPYTGGGATTTGGLDRNGNKNPNASLTWGGKSGGAAQVSYSEALYLQVGANRGQKVELGRFQLSAQDIGVGGVSVSSFSSAGAAIQSFDNGIEAISQMRSYYGALQNRLEHTIANLDSSEENTQAAESRIRDLDMAEGMVEYSKNQILQQAGQSMLAQANRSAEGVLSLLQ